jgi:hypothetical protein
VIEFECHVTCAKPNNMRFYEDIATKHGWNSSFIEGDPLLGKQGFFYFTRHAASYDSLFTTMEVLCKALADVGTKVLRKKIEQVLYDTRKELV